ncbi:vitronectin isoform X2 [Hyla sarda]|uniref:vitronectin isoform X2 n=1 Tax=Hyla sarda TaxID=327740 RepID=UPI0024C32BE4|nr:vitronectin isoform X2 [Hyla sarda]XP_056414711.1 vitronectin isoform X2 [Hyla sarda]
METAHFPAVPVSPCSANACCLRNVCHFPESCVGRCLDGFDIKSKCQCDNLCIYYKSCCHDYISVCKPKETRGDVFAIPEDEYNYDTFNDTSDQDWLIQATTSPDEHAESAHTTPTYVTPTEEPSVTEDTPEELCSGKPFDAFTNFKNGSVYAFRGKYFYELDDKRALDGYPKLIKDVWGIEGPIDAAFTRLNCEGKTYIFKGTQYWRFTDVTMDSGFPRAIDEGFSNIPDNIDAAFSLPANNYEGSEKAYFFKGSRYWQYEFKNQPTMEECMTSSPSERFTQYVMIQYDSLEQDLDFIFGGWFRDSYEVHRSISRDWKGVPNGIDAVLLSRLYVPKKKKTALRRSKRRKNNKRKNRKRKPSWSDGFDILDDLFGYNYDYDDEYDPDWVPPESPPKCQPVQSVYFFKKDKYYRVNLQTKRVDRVSPRYPRSIAEYWLGCKSSKEKKTRG